MRIVEMEGQVPIGHVSITTQIREVVSGNETPFAEAEIVRFWAKVQKTEGCWLWTASRSGGRRHGTYGQFTYTVDKRQRHISAHAFSFILHHGPVPEGCEVMHLCDRHICVRPDHLEAGTRLQNVADAAAKGAYRVPRPDAQKLTDAQCEEIRSLAAVGMKQYVIAERFGVTKGWVSLFLKGKRRNLSRPSTKKEQAA
jgi:hypothetical protein